MGSETDAGVDEKLLNRIGAMLAKAESTPYPAEAETFFARAQALMAQHSISEAMLSGTGVGDNEITSEIMRVEAPYAVAKSSLLGGIARANGCKTIRLTSQTPRGKRSGEGYNIHVFGAKGDLRNVATLYAALSVHATRCMLNEEVPYYENTKSFRHAFMLTFAGRISERLEEIRKASVREYEEASGHSTSLVLVERDKLVTQARAEKYPSIVTKSVSYRRGAGEGAGIRAANSANLGQRGVAGSRGVLAR